ncbi:MAG: nucleotidyltransferase [Candidatus Methanofastidiosa archaeon]|nr:nucleotidyltransferase [Candidatus Methanofastidiosa archaeon]
MGSGGSRRILSSSSPEELREKLRKSRENTEDAAFETNVNAEINEILAEYNERDSDAIQEHLDEIKEIIGEDIEGMLDLKFGGSISKYTYVNGLSDVDTLITIDKTELSDLPPKEVLEHIKSKLEGTLKNLEKIDIGKLAVTMEFSDNIKIQILPAIKRGDGFKIPNSNGNDWSNTIKPKKFAEKLTEVNKNLKGNVVPVIKLAKGILANLPENQQLKGYHVESIAIEAFKTYPESKSKTYKTLLKHFFEKAKDIVKKPMIDSTGQSRHVDTYLGSENSKERQTISYTLNRIYNKMERADKISSVSEWTKILGE